MYNLNNFGNKDANVPGPAARRPRPFELLKMLAKGAAQYLPVATQAWLSQNNRLGSGE